MRSTRKKIEAKLGSFAFRRLQRWVLKQDAAKTARWGERVGRLIYRLSKKRRLRTLANLELAFPEKSDAERRQIARGVFEHFGRVAGEFMRSSLRTNEEVLANCTFEGREHLEGALALGKGVLLITAHFGNWEMAAHWVAASGYKMSVIARDANDSDMNDLVNMLRESTGVKVIARGNAARPTLTRLRQNEIVAILPDQNSDEAFVPFFGRPAGTVQGPAVLSLRSGAPLLPVFCLVTGPGKLHLIIRPTIEPALGIEDPTLALTTAINACIEETVRHYPEQYLWMHDRWKNARKRGLL